METLTLPGLLFSARQEIPGFPHVILVMIRSSFLPPRSRSWETVELPYKPRYDAKVLTLCTTSCLFMERSDQQQSRSQRAGARVAGQSGGLQGGGRAAAQWWEGGRGGKGEQAFQVGGNGEQTQRQGKEKLVGREGRRQARLRGCGGSSVVKSRGDTLGSFYSHI